LRRAPNFWQLRPKLRLTLGSHSWTREAIANWRRVIKEKKQ
jgi:hypothetical protein